MAKVLKCECKAKNMNFGKFHRSTMLHGLLAWIGQRDYVGNWLNIKSKRKEIWIWKYGLDRGTMLEIG